MKQIRFQMATKTCPFVLTDQESKELREAFNMFDKEGSGTIEAAEIRVALRVLGFEAHDEEVQALISQHDKDKSARIDFDEFTQILLMKLAEPQPVSQLIRAFHIIDKDGDDRISLSDLMGVAEELGENLDVDELREIIMSARGKANQFDIHTKDVGSISQSEFLAAIRKIYQ